MRTTDNSDLNFEYRFRWGSIYMGIAMFGLAAIFFAFKGMTGAVRFAMGDLLYLTGTAATIAYGVVAAVFGCISLSLAAFALRLRKSPPSIQINSRRVLIPRSTFSKKFVAIKFSEVQKVESNSRGSRKQLCIVHNKGTTTISERMAGSRRNFDELVSLVEKFSQQALTGRG